MTRKNTIIAILHWLVILPQVSHLGNYLQHQLKEDFPGDLLQWGIFMAFALQFAKYKKV